MMNTQNENIEDTLLDRLVDGELSDAEYRKLLHALESQHDGWRRCALAFLEAQAWKREVNGLRGEMAVPRAQPVVASQRGSWFYFGAMVLASAASFLLAFGIAMNLPTRNEANPSHPSVAENELTTEDEWQTQLPNPQLVSNSSLDSPESAVGKYRLIVDSGSADVEAVEMPVFSADDPRAGMLLDEYATRPHGLIRALESQGNQVHRQRNWIPMPGNSQIPVYVPVDELQVTPVSSRSFQ